MVNQLLLRAVLATLLFAPLAPAWAQREVTVSNSGGDQKVTTELQQSSPGANAVVVDAPQPLQPLEPQDARSLLQSGADLVKPERLTSTLQVMLLLSVLSLAPAVLLMTTSFVRVIVVLGLLRQALGAQQLPPSQVLTSIALFVTLLVMAPVWKASYEEGLKPYADGQIGLEEAFEGAAGPIRRFMADQIQRTGNDADVYMLLSYIPEEQAAAAGGDPPYAYYDPKPGERVVPLAALLPAFMLSELKTAFLIGFQLYLPFLVIDLVVASVTISMGMLMLPPVLISLPFKLLLFVLVDGWRLVVEMLIESFALYGAT